MRKKVCYTCCDKNIHSDKLFAAHLELFHGIDAKTQRFTRVMHSHFDGAEWYTTVWIFTGAGVEFRKSETCQRDAESKFLWLDIGGEG